MSRKVRSSTGSMEFCPVWILKIFPIQHHEGYRKDNLSSKAYTGGKLQDSKRKLNVISKITDNLG